MKGNTIEELIDIIAKTGEATFLYKNEEYQILTDGFSSVLCNKH